MKNLFVFMVFIVALFVVGQTCVAKGKKEPTEHVIPKDIQTKVNALALEIGTLTLQKQVAEAQILARQNAITYILDMWKVSVGVLEVEFPNWTLQGNKLIKK